MVKLLLTLREHVWLFSIHSIMLYSLVTFRSTFKLNYTLSKNNKNHDLKGIITECVDIQRNIIAQFHTISKEEFQRCFDQ